jgi:hypothetical protein
MTENPASPLSQGGKVSLDIAFYRTRHALSERAGPVFENLQAVHACSWTLSNQEHERYCRKYYRLNSKGQLLGKAYIGS